MLWHWKAPCQAFPHLFPLDRVRFRDVKMKQVVLETAAEERLLPLWPPVFSLVGGIQGRCVAVCVSVKICSYRRREELRRAKSRTESFSYVYICSTLLLLSLRSSLCPHLHFTNVVGFDIERDWERDRSRFLNAGYVGDRVPWLRSPYFWPSRLNGP